MMAVETGTLSLQTLSPALSFQTCYAVQFRKEAKNMVDFVCDYYNNVEGMPVRSSVEVSSQLLSYTARLRQLPARLIRACATEEHALLAVQLAYCLHPAVCMAEAVTTAAAMQAARSLLPAACCLHRNSCMAEGDGCLPVQCSSLLPAAPFLPGCNSVTGAAAAVQPGYLAKLVPEEAPIEGELLEDIMSDVRQKIMPGMPPGS